MAKIHLDRLKSRYQETPVEGSTYRELMNEIIANNTENISRAVNRIQSDHWQKQAARIKRSTTTQIAVPGLEEVLPKRSVFARKGAEQGQLITDALRDQITANLRATVKEYLSEGKGSMQYRRGEQRGRIRPELVDKMESRLRETFSGYTRGDATGIPPNVRAIAETETRSTISDIKYQYAKRLHGQNQGKMRIMKRWNHHPSLSKRPRANHRMIDGQERPIDAPFKVPVLERSRDRGVGLGGYIYMMHPHDPTAPASEVISCHCDVDYFVAVL